MPHTARELRRIHLLGALKSEFREIRVDLSDSFLFLYAPDNQRQSGVCLNCAVGKEQVLLKHITDFSRYACNVLAVEQDFTLLRTVQTRNYVEQRGFAAAAHTEQADDLAFADGKLNVFDYIDLVVVGICDIPGFKPVHLFLQILVCKACVLGNLHFEEFLLVNPVVERIPARAVDKAP